jgi:hypothetical protein
VEDQIWTFTRDEERLTLLRQETKDGFLLVVTENGTPQSHSFKDLAQLTEFQADTEEFLFHSGWVFEAFSPDRRGGIDRRTVRRLNDRRRWWTDGDPDKP